MKIKDPFLREQYTAKNSQSQDKIGQMRQKVCVVAVRSFFVYNDAHDGKNRQNR